MWGPRWRLPSVALSLALVRSASVGCDWLEGLSFLPGGSVVISLVSRGGFSCVPELGSLGSGVGGSPELGSLGSGLWEGGSHDSWEVLRHSPLPSSPLASGLGGRAVALSSGITDWPPGRLCSSLFQRPVLSPPPCGNVPVRLGTPACRRACKRVRWAIPSAGRAVMERCWAGACG